MKLSVKIFSALAVGIATGAMIGILFAPDKGSETRRKMSERGKKVANDISEKLESFKESCNNKEEEILS
jgi:gas vesicle protein